MELIVGLGNPEADYSKTRHNMGFNVINELAEKYNIEVNKKKFDSLYGEGMIEGKKVILLKPQTYMNLSGDAIIQVVRFYKIPMENIYVIYDDMDIEPGQIKIRKKGGAGSHNGMKSVVNNLQTEEFARIRVGIGTPKDKQDAISYVIGAIPGEEIEVLNKGVEQAAEAMVSILKEGIDKAMNTFN